MLNEMRLDVPAYQGGHGLRLGPGGTLVLDLQRYTAQIVAGDFVRLRPMDPSDGLDVFFVEIATGHVVRRGERNFRRGDQAILVDVPTPQSERYFAAPRDWSTVTRAFPDGTTEDMFFERGPVECEPLTSEGWSIGPEGHFLHRRCFYARDGSFITLLPGYAAAFADPAVRF